jgi:ATP-dependent Clp protease ATP-binding subunit ClpC
MAMAGGGQEETPKKDDRYITKYCINLNEEVAKENPRIYGRDEELGRLIEVLSCKTKNNAILTGEAGTGKTSVIYLLAQKINRGEVPIFLSRCKIYSFDVGLMVAGTRYRGQFEERLKGLIKEIKEESNAILFIDEILTSIGAGAVGDDLDMSNMLKPALARGELMCIGATTQEEYRKSFEKDAALNRRFQSIKIGEPSKERTREIIMDAKVDYEAFHGVEYTPEIIDHVLNAAEKYLPYRRNPDKSFEVIDRIGAIGRIEKFKYPEKLETQKSKLIHLMAETTADDKKNTKKCERSLKKWLDDQNNWIQSTVNTPFILQEEHVKSVISMLAKVEIDKVELGQPKSILNLKDSLATKVFDQEEALIKIADLLICSKAGIRKRKKTLANLLFVGPTGVGKTYTAKLIAEEFFNTPNCFLQIDMAEYVDKYTISKLVGATAGYVGYKEGGILTEFVRNNPHSLVLFDEVEKAHPDVTNILLKIMDEGFLIDSFGAKIDFSGTIIVITGNVGAEVENARSMGFNEPKKGSERNVGYEKAIKEFFKPELISRLDEKIIFNGEFSKAGMMNMIRAYISEVSESLLKKGVSFVTDESLIESIYEVVKKDGNNARAIQGFVSKKFELPLARFMLSLIHI